MKRIFRDAGNLVSGQAGTVVIGLVNMAILARVLTTEEMGVYSLFLMVVNLVLILGLNWSDASIVRHGKEEFVQTGRINRSFWARLMLFVPVIVVASLIMLAFRKPIAAYIGIAPWMIVLVISLFLVNGLVKYMMKMLQSINLMGRSAYINLFQKLFYLIGLAVLFFGYAEASVLAVVIFFNLSFLLVLAYNLLLFDFSVIRPLIFDKEQFRKIWSYSWPQLIGFGGLYIINYIDLYVIRRYMELSDVGVYSIAYSGFSIICGFIMLINTLFLPVIVEYRTKRWHRRIRSYMRKLPLFAVLFAGAAILGTLISGFVIPLLFSEKYADAVPSFNILLIASIFYFISIYLLPVVNAFDLIIYSQVFNIIKSIVNIIGDFVLVPAMGIAGAAYGTLISYAVGAVLSIMLVYIKRRKITG